MEQTQKSHFLASLKCAHNFERLIDPVDFTLTSKYAEIARNIDEIHVQAVELNQRFSIFMDKFNGIGYESTRLNKSFNAAVVSAQRQLLPQGRRFAELAGHNCEIAVSDQIDEVVREIQAGE